MSHCNSRHSLGIQEYLEREEKGRIGEEEEIGEKGKSGEGEEESGKCWITHSVTCSCMVDTQPGT